MNLSPITRARLLLSAILQNAALHPAMIHVGVYAPSFDDVEADASLRQDFFKTIPSSKPSSYTLSDGVVTVGFQDPHGFRVGDIVIIHFAILSQQYAVTVSAVTSTSIQFASPQSLGGSFHVILDGDLVFIPAVFIKPAVLESTEILEGIPIFDEKIEVLFYYTIQYDSESFIAIEHLSREMARVMATMDYWEGLNAGPSALSMEESHLDRRDNAVPGYYKFTLTFKDI